MPKLNPRSIPIRETRVTASAWMRHWFGSGSTPAAKGAGQPPIRYSPQLLPGLLHDHRELLAVYAEIERMAVDGRCATLTGALAGFKSRFDLHVLNENLHFYGYLEERLGRRTELLAQVKQWRAEMGVISRGVAKFVRKYDEAGVRPANVASFLEELRALGAQLKQRLEREEKEFYPLYRP